MAGGPYTFDYVNKYILIPPGEIVTNMIDVYNAAMDWIDSDDGMVHELPIEAIGKAPLGNDVYTDTIYKLLNGWKLKFTGAAGSPPWPMGFNVKRGILFESFEEIYWQIVPAKSSPTASIFHDPTNHHDGKYGMRLIPGQDGGEITTTLTFPGPMNMSWVESFDWWIYIDDVNTFEYIHLESYNDSTAKMKYSLLPTEMFSGWNRVILASREFLSINGGSWSNDMFMWEIHYKCKPGNYSFITFDNIRVNRDAVGTVVFLFRDARTGLYDYAFPMMQAMGFKGTMYIDKDLVGLPGYCTIQQIKEIYDAGWDVLPNTHVSFAGQSIDFIRTELKRQQRYLEDNLIDRTKLIYKYPSDPASWLDFTVKEQMEDFFVYGITNISGTNSYPPDDHFHVRSYRLDSSIHPVSYLSELVMYAHYKKTMLILGIRDVQQIKTNTSDYDTTEFQEFLDYMRNHMDTFHAGNNMVVTFAEAQQKMGAYQANITGTTIVDRPDLYGSNRTIQPDEGSVEITFQVTSSATIISQLDLLNNTTETNKYVKLIPALI